MKKEQNPLDALTIALLVANNSMIVGLGQVTTRDVYEQNSTIFHNDGLFSTRIFNETGSTERLTQFGYIDIILDIIHPAIYDRLASIRSLYKHIIDGTKYAVWDEKESDFIEATAIEGKTGYSFFFKYYNKIKYKNPNNLISKEVDIEYVSEHPLNEIIFNKNLVLPAGLREYTVTESGKVMEAEINSLYRKLITVANTAKVFKSDNTDNEVINKVKVRLQSAVNDIYHYIENLLDGKGGYIQGKFTKRSISYGTRNVITAIPNIVKDVRTKERAGPLSSILGVYQLAKGVYPFMIYNLRTKFLSDIFSDQSTMARLIDTKTYERKTIEISEKSRSDWVTDDGLEGIINKCKYDNITNSPIIVDGMYILLVYEDGDKVEIINNLEDKEYPIEKIRPITYGELLFLSIISDMDNFKGIVTRYPITGLGSTVPSDLYLKTTVKSKFAKISILGSDVLITTNEYPIIGGGWFRSLSIPSIYLERLGADFDGDKVSLNIIWSKDIVEDIKAKMKTVEYFIGTDGKILFSTDTYINQIVMKIFTEKVKS